MTTTTMISSAHVPVASDPGIVSMLTGDEKSLYYHVASQYEGRGAVVEIGPWLGSGTFQICSALERSGRDWSLTVLDRFVWSKLYAGRYDAVRLKPGDSFLPLFEQNLAPFAARLHKRRGELTDIAALLPLPEGSAIELLFVDAPKSWRMLWTVLAHVGPHLVPGAQLVFQDFFHITSRQIVWLLSRLPQLEMTHLVDDGTAVTFRARGPIEAMAAVAPAQIEGLSVADLMALWEEIGAAVPERRLGDLAAGMALDLLERGALAEATAVLRDGAAARPWTPEVIREVERLARYSEARGRQHLRLVATFLKTDIALAELAAGQPEIFAPDGVGPLGGLERPALLGALAEVARLASPAAVALAYQATQRPPLERTRALLPAFAALVEAGGGDWLAGLGAVAGLDVVEFGFGPNLHGIACRAAGARSHTLVDPEHCRPDQRTVRGEATGQRIRLKDSLAEIAAADGALAFRADASPLAAATVDLAIVHEADEASFRKALAQARRLLRPGGTLRVEWRNALGWSGHGKTPQSLAEYDPDDPEQRARADWRHAVRAARTSPPPSRVAELVAEAGFSDPRATRVFDDLEILARLTPGVRRSVTDIPARDLATRTLLVVATRADEAAAGPAPGGGADRAGAAPAHPRDAPAEESGATSLRPSGADRAQGAAERGEEAPA